VELVPARLNFCSEPVGTTSKAKQVTLTNTGAASLTIRSINPTGTDAGDFAVHKTTCAARASDSGCRSRLYDQCYVYSNGDGDKDCLSLRHRHWWG
jgi:hypothetical protein